MVDTSVLIAGISAFRGTYERGRNDSADFLWDWIQRGHFLWLVTAEILDEYIEVARRKGIPPHIVGRLLNLLREEAEWVSVPAGIRISPDPGDDAFCGCAEEGDAAFLVTLNPRDFPAEKLSAKVVTPVAFLKRTMARPG